ncbi:MAG: hypothetical protein GX558_02880 [Clostridiales bacterium]|nr:hypothetical protein [Clostridiales bacterium]
MEADVRQLTQVVACARMGMDAVDRMMEQTGDADIRLSLLRQRDQYQAVLQDAQGALAARGDYPLIDPIITPLTK